MPGISNVGDALIVAGHLAECNIIYLAQIVDTKKRRGTVECAKNFILTVLGSLLLIMCKGIGGILI